MFGVMEAQKETHLKGFSNELHKGNLELILQNILGLDREQQLLYQNPSKSWHLFSS